MNYKFKQLLGYTKYDHKPIYLDGFSWDCGWYWGGGHILKGLVLLKRYLKEKITEMRVFYLGRGLRKESLLY